jgi:hypothetical protein
VPSYKAFIVSNNVKRRHYDRKPAGDGDGADPPGACEHQQKRNQK